MNAPSVQPKAIFEHADTFFHAIDRLQRSPSAIISAVAMPVMVVSAFAAELYFKTLIVLDGKPAPRSHDLYDLFSKLSPTTRTNLEDRWNLIIRDRQEFLRNVERQESSIPRLLEDAIKEGREGFERLRYIYEGGDPFRFFLGDLPIALRRTILDLQPTWSPQDTLFLGRIPSDPIPDHLKEGSITFWLRNPDTDWCINTKHYDFGTSTINGHSITSYKTADKRISFTISGPLGRTFTFNEPLIPGNNKDVFVCLTWTPAEILFYLNAKQSGKVTIAPSRSP